MKASRQRATRRLKILTHMSQLESNDFWRDNVFGLGVLMENKGEILSRYAGKRNRQIWCARIRGVSHVTPLLGNARNTAVMAAVTRQRDWRWIRRVAGKSSDSYIIRLRYWQRWEVPASIIYSFEIWTTNACHSYRTLATINHCFTDWVW
jgi:hypothetical protein